MAAVSPNLFYRYELEFSRIDFLMFLDISIGQDNLSALPKKEEGASDVLVTYPQLEDITFLIDQLSQWWPVSLTRLELLHPRNDEFVQYAILFSQVLQEDENRFVPISVVVKADTKLHRAPAVSVCVLQHLCCIVHEGACSCNTDSIW
jgi:hypothetical protein